MIDKNNFNKEFTDIYNKYKRLICYIAYSMVRNYDEANDISSECFQSFMNISIKKGMMPANISQYLSSSVHNLCINRIKENSRLVELDQNMINRLNYNNDSIYNDDIEKLLLTLNKADKKIIIMHGFFGMTFKEISTHIGTPLGTVCTKYSRSIKKLRNEIMQNKQ